jgi:hypothetical protein
MGQVARKLISFYRYTRGKRLKPKYIFTVILLESVWIIHFPDKLSILIILGVILSFLPAWEYYEYVKEIQAVRRRVGRCRGIRSNIAIGRNGSEIELGEMSFTTERSPGLPVSSTVDYVSTTSTYLPSSADQPPRVIVIRDGKVVRDDLRKIKTPTIRKIREK